MRLILAAVLLLSSCGPSVSSGASATAAPSPPYRGPLPAGGFQVGITYDSIRHVTVVLDVTSNPFTVETWTWNGSAWQHLHPSVSPDAVLSLAFDAAHQRVVGFGRNLNASPEIVAPGETWTWDGESWRQELPQTRPPGRQQPSLVYDGKRERVVMAGGVGRPNEQLTDTWAWDGANWSRLPDTPEPFFDLNRGAYDPARDLIVIHTFEADAHQMLLWDGQSWSVSTATNGALPLQAPLTYDRGLKRIVLFGDEVDTTSRPPNSIGGPPSTWGWDGSNWTNINTGTGPYNRLDQQLVYDSDRGVLVLFGGESLGPTYGPAQTGCCSVSAANDLWEFDGRRWLKRA